MTFNKLVRDKIPDLIRAEGNIPEFEVLNNSAFEQAMNEKLLEECQELLTAADSENRKEEMADVLEILQAMAKFHGISFSEVEEIRNRKCLERGSFDRKIFLKGKK